MLPELTVAKAPTNNLLLTPPDVRSHDVLPPCRSERIPPCLGRSPSFSTFLLKRFPLMLNSAGRCLLIGPTSFCSLHRRKAHPKKQSMNAYVVFKDEGGVAKALERSVNILELTRSL